MAAILLDTTVLIDALRGRSAAERIRSLRRRGDTPFTSAINVEELIRGIKKGEEQAVLQLMRGLRVAALGFEEGRQAGEWRRRHAARGVTLSQADCLIAAAAHSLGATLATGNPKDFPMRELPVEAWHVGE